MVLIAVAPAFASIPVHGAAVLGATAETDTLAPAQTSTILTAGASGTKIEEVVIHAAKTATLVATTVAGLVYLFIHDGTNYRLFDTVVVNGVIASATAVPFRASNKYTNLVLKSGESLRASQSIAGNVSILVVHAHGADF